MQLGNTSNYKYPNKLIKYKIDKPSLRIFVAKYENIIPWNKRIMNESTLEDYINLSLLPEFFRLIKWPLSVDIKKSYFVDLCHVNLESYFSGFLNSESELVQKLREIQTNKGDNEAKVCLCNSINFEKYLAFKEWVDHVKKIYHDDPAFIYLLLTAVFDTSSYGSRRIVATPDKDTINWLYQLLQNDQINPSQNIAKVYFFKAAFGAGNMIKNGWQFISSGKHNLSKLTAAAHGSGWCIASNSMASLYLEHCSFYILRSSEKAVVALRVIDNCVYECRGINNTLPNDYIHDIFAFSQYQKLEVNFKFFFDVESISFQGYSASWWHQRMKFWPGIYFQVPNELKNSIEKFKPQDFYIYFEFIPILQLEQDFQFNLSIEDCIQILLIYPYLFKNIINKANGPKEELEFKNAWIEGSIKKIKMGQLTINEIKAYPEEVKKSALFYEAVKKLYKKEIYKIIFRKPSSLYTRTNRPNLDHIIDYAELESYDITVGRFASKLINLETTDFSNNFFTEDVLKRADFEALRREVWKLAIQERPTFRIVLPIDLAQLQEFELKNIQLEQSQKEKYLMKIKERPWLLDSKGAIPKKIKYTKDALDEYIKSWSKIISRDPTKLWIIISRLFNTRTYISFAALRHREIIETFYYGFLVALNKEKDIWHEVTRRTSLIPEIILAFLLALHHSKNEKMKKKYFGERSAIYLENSISEIMTINRRIINGDGDLFHQKFLENKLGEGLDFFEF
jgi:hypothetical protein